MPFTPLHLGPALALGYMLRRVLHWPTFIIANLLVDVEPLLVLTGLLGDYPLHGYLHTLLASLLAGPLLGYAMSQVDRPLRDLYRGLALVGEEGGGVRGYVSAGALGWALHVLLDAPLYSDIKPLYPSPINPFLMHQRYVGLYLNLVFLTLLAGVAACSVNMLAANTRRYGLPRALMQVGISLILASLLLLSTLNPLSFPASMVTATCGLTAFHVAMIHLARPRRRRIAASLACMLAAVSVVTLRFAYQRLPLGDVEQLSSMLARDWPLSTLLPWVMVLAGLLMLYHPVKDVARDLADERLRHAYAVLVLGWVLSMLLAGIFVLAVALLLMLAEVTKTGVAAT